MGSLGFANFWMERWGGKAQEELFFLKIQLRMIINYLYSRGEGLLSK
ncbi:hypothetical protein HPL003_02755 [Paenibacillus terrae HPL-003]|uniref:Uncharacterized protein n=1 Tax=Paenibacillus terrae (strain HPL-003) TaxID=985665 RepID=G7W1F0_PAETH|nr:hypothetical protein HPL003_02755 [Paenibacillus terrae HPL-003]